MSRRTSIIKSLVAELQTIDGTGIYTTNIYNNAYPILKFWDEINDYPALYVTPGTESREYLPGGFAWGFLNISIKLYAKGEDGQLQLEQLLEDVEKCLDLNRSLVYDTESGEETTDLTIQSIMTDEGLLAPYAVGEMTMQVRYQIM